MKVWVDDDRCQGHTLCAVIAPGTFVHRDDDGHAYVASEDVAPGMEGKVRAAAASCPEQAITVE